MSDWKSYRCWPDGRIEEIEPSPVVVAAAEALRRQRVLDAAVRIIADRWWPYKTRQRGARALRETFYLDDPRAPFAVALVRAEFQRLWAERDA